METSTAKVKEQGSAMCLDRFFNEQHPQYREIYQGLEALLFVKVEEQDCSLRRGQVFEEFVRRTGDPVQVQSRDIERHIQKLAIRHEAELSGGVYTVPVSIRLNSLTTDGQC
jgi:hypothetical protein